MAGEFNLTFEVAGEQQVLRGFSRFADKVQDMRPFFHALAKDFHDLERRQFESEGQSGSAGWPALSPRYARWKAMHYPGKTILVRTGLLKGSLAGNNGYTVEDIQPLQARLGTLVPYAIYHQKGGPRLPKRSPIQLSNDDKARWTKMAHEHLVEEAKKEGLL